MSGLHGVHDRLFLRGQYDLLIESTRAKIEHSYSRSLADRLFRDMLYALFPYTKRLRQGRYPSEVRTQRLASPRPPLGPRTLGAGSLCATRRMNAVPCRGSEARAVLSVQDRYGAPCASL